MSRLISWLRRGFSNPMFLLAVAAALIAFAVQSGELGSSDTQHREQAAHSFWTNEPAVFPYEYPEFGVRGRDGSLQNWYGIGQSLLMLPFDVAGTFAERLPAFADYNGNDPSVRNIVVSYGVNILLNVLTALVCFRFLVRLRFTVAQAVAGTLALLLATTHLHYTQNMMENNSICLLTLAGFSYQFAWLRSNARRDLLLGSAALGLNLLTRLTTGLDLMAAAMFVVLAVWMEGTRGVDLWRRAKRYATVAVPVYCCFGVIDRLYQYHRFGSFVNTYVGLAAREERMRDPLLPPSFPFSTPFHVGFLGALFAPEKSIFLFDPLLILMVLMVAVGWRKFSPAVKAYTLVTALTLAVYVCFYARYFVWSGDTAWGDRYVSTAAELAALLAVPLLLQLRNIAGRAVWIAGVALIAASAVVQMASVAFWHSLELYQMETLGHPTFVVLLRLRNIAGFALGRMDAWGLANGPMHRDPWDYQHITCWNFLPFLLERVGEAPAWVVRAALCAWLASLAALGGVLWRLWRVVRESCGDEGRKG
jgi:hypothetical protein